jgi:hypothetical protein
MVAQLEVELNDIAVKNVPSPKNLNRTKKWWSQDLSTQRNTLRQIFHAWQQNRSPATFNHYQDARKQYKQSIAKAKKDHFVTYMETISDPEIFCIVGKDKGFAAMVPPLTSSNGLATSWEDKSSLLFDTLNKADIQTDAHQQYVDPQLIPEISAYEISKAIDIPSPNKAPSHDTIPYSLIKMLNQSHPDILWWIFNSSIRAAYHPKSWTKSIGVVLAKHNKPDYASPKAYRIIALIPNFSKTLERIMLHRFMQHQHTLLHPTQTGSRQSHSTTDALMALVERAEKAKIQKGFKTGILALDVEGGFDNIQTTKLVQRLQEANIHNI